VPFSKEGSSSLYRPRRGSSSACKPMSNRLRAQYPRGSAWERSVGSESPQAQRFFLTSGLRLTCGLKGVHYAQSRSKYSIRETSSNRHRRINFKVREVSDKPVQEATIVRHSARCVRAGWIAAGKRSRKRRSGFWRNLNRPLCNYALSRY
jgi:hypothetical protein